MLRRWAMHITCTSTWTSHASFTLLPLQGAVLYNSRKMQHLNRNRLMVVSGSCGMLLLVLVIAISPTSSIHQTFVDGGSQRDGLLCDTYPHNIFLLLFVHESNMSNPDSALCLWDKCFIMFDLTTVLLIACVTTLILESHSTLTNTHIQPLWKIGISPGIGRPYFQQCKYIRPLGCVHTITH
jgi:hypothetical protein